MRTPHTLLSMAAAVLVASCMSSPVRREPEATGAVKAFMQTDTLRFTIYGVNIRDTAAFGRQLSFDVSIEALKDVRVGLNDYSVIGMDDDGREYSPKAFTGKEPTLPTRDVMKSGERVRGWVSYAYTGGVMPKIMALRFTPIQGEPLILRFGGVSVK